MGIEGIFLNPQKTAKSRTARHMGELFPALPFHSSLTNSRSNFCPAVSVVAGHNFPITHYQGRRSGVALLPTSSFSILRDWYRWEQEQAVNTQHILNKPSLNVKITTTFLWVLVPVWNDCQAVVPSNENRSSLSGIQSGAHLFQKKHLI